MKATVLASFRAKDDRKVIYIPGEVMDIDNDRAVALAARGLVRLHEEIPSKSDDKESAKSPSAKNGAKTPSKGKGKGKTAKKDEEIADDSAKSDSENADPESDPNPGDAQDADETAESPDAPGAENDSNVKE